MENNVVTVPRGEANALINALDVLRHSLGTLMDSVDSKHRRILGLSDFGLRSSDSRLDSRDMIDGIKLACRYMHAVSTDSTDDLLMSLREDIEAEERSRCQACGHEGEAGTPGCLFSGDPEEYSAPFIRCELGTR